MEILETNWIRFKLLDLIEALLQLYDIAFLRNVKNEKSECSASKIVKSESKKNESESKNPIESFAEVTLLIGSDVIVLHTGVVVQGTGCVHLLTHLGKRRICKC